MRVIGYTECKVDACFQTVAAWFSTAGECARIGRALRWNEWTCGYAGIRPDGGHGSIRETGVGHRSTTMANDKNSEVFGGQRSSLGMSRAEVKVSGNDFLIGKADADPFRPPPPGIDADLHLS